MHHATDYATRHAMNRLWLLALVCLTTLALPSCGSDEDDCVSLCEDAQARDCTSITGDCDAFCGSLFAVEDDAGCADSRSSYQECLNDEGVCGGCDSEENELSSCVGEYCVSHSSNDDCQVLLASF